jgi:hypothetical protein
MEARNRYLNGKASEGTRTLNPRITNAMLYQLKLRWRLTMPGARMDRTLSNEDRREYGLEVEMVKWFTVFKGF